MRLLLFGALTACALTFHPAYAGGVTHLEADGGLVDWTLDAASGRVFAVDYPGNAVRELSPTSGKRVRSFKTGTQPTRALVKRGVLAVTNQGSQTLTLVDLSSNQVAGHVSLNAQGPYSLFASGAREHPYVYVIGQQEHRGVIVQVDVTRRTITQRLQPTFRVSAGRTQGVVSADGERLLLTDGSDLCRLALEEGPKTRFTQVARAYVSSSRSGHGLGAGAHGRYWVRGNQLFTDAIKKAVRTFAGAPVALHPKLDLAFSIVQADRWRPSSATLQVQRFGSAVSVKQVPLFKVSRRSSRRYSPHRSFRSAPQLRLDAGRKRLLYAWGEQACVIDLKALALPSDPLVLLDAPATATVSLGERLSLPLKLTDASLSPTFELTAAPNGARIRSGRLTWTPTRAQVGLHTIAVTAKVGKAQDVAQVQVQVTRPQVALPFTIAQLAVDPAGKYAVASNVGGRYSFRRGAAPPTQLALIDLTERRLIATRTLTKQIGTVHVDASGVFLGAKTGNALYALKLSDLSDRRRAFVNNGPVGGLFQLGEGELGVMTRRGIQALDATTLKPLRTLQPVDRFGSRRESGAAVPLSDGRRVGGRVFDPAGKQVMTLGHPGYGVPLLGQSGHSARGGLPTLWNRQVSSGQISDAAGQQVASLPRDGLSYSSQAEVVFQAAPAVGRLLVRSERKTARRILTLDAHDLIEGGRKQTQTLAVLPPRQGSSIDAPRPLLAQVADRVVAAYERAVFVLPVAEELRKLPQPVELAHRLASQTVAHDKSVSATLQARGGKGGYTFTLGGEQPGLTLNQATGALTLDGAALWSSFLSQIQQRRSLGRRALLRWSQTVTRSQARYQQLFGAPTKAFAVFLTLPLTVADKEGQSVTYQVPFAVTGPAIDVKEAMGAAGAQPVAGPAPAPPSIPGGAPSIPANAGSQSTTALTLRLNRTERALKTVREELARLDSVPPPTPVDAPTRAEHDALQAKLADALLRVDLLEERNASYGLGLIGALLGAAGLIAALVAILLGQRRGEPLPLPIEALPPLPTPEKPRRKRSRAASAETDELPVRKKKKKKKRRKKRRLEPQPDDLVGAGSGRQSAVE